MGLMSEWKAFAAVAVDWLGMPVEAMPLYYDSSRWKRKAKRIVSFIMETGNFGHNRDNSYFRKYSYVVRKTISLWRHTCDSVKRFFIFPVDSVRVWWRMFVGGIGVALRGK